MLRADRRRSRGEPASWSWRPPRRTARTWVVAALFLCDLDADDIQTKIAPCLCVEVEAEQAEAGSHCEGGGGEELLARVDLDLENKKIKTR